MASVLYDRSYAAFSFHLWSVFPWLWKVLCSLLSHGQAEGGRNALRIVENVFRIVFGLDFSQPFKISSIIGFWPVFYGQVRSIDIYTFRKWFHILSELFYPPDTRVWPLWCFPRGIKGDIWKCLTVKICRGVTGNFSNRPSQSVEKDRGRIGGRTVDIAFNDIDCFIRQQFI